MPPTAYRALLLCLLLAAGGAAAQDRTIESRSGPLRLQTVATGLERPWGLAFLPDGRALVTERPGRLRLIGADGKVSDPLGGVPQVYARGQGGLLDIALSPDFATSRLVYFSYAEPGDDGASTAVARGRLGDGRLDNVELVFRQVPKVDGGNHFGSRVVFGRDGTLFVALGERFAFEPAQDLMSHLGKVVRINADGTVPHDNPFVGRQDVRPEIWSYGHRNIQGAALHPQSGALWVAEMGPKGGDELNIAEAGKNYGWPLVSWGDHYNGKEILKPSRRPDLAGSVAQWTPVIAPSGMVFYTGANIPEWRGNVLIGGLVQQGITRVTLDGAKVTDEERISLGTRIRDVRQGPGGAVYVLTDETNGRMMRLSR